MFKKIVGFTVLSAVLSTFAFADEASVKKAFEVTYPKFKVDSVAKTPFSGLYEVFVGGQIIYTDEKLSYVIVEGRLVDAKTKQDLTSNRMDELTRIDFSKLPLDQAIKVVKGDGSRKLAVFSDVDCPYCKRLERDELVNITNVTIYTFLYPIVQLHPDSANKSKSIWCAKDRVKAWEDWILRDQLPKTIGHCDVPIERIGELARKIGVNGTPAIIFADGRRSAGLLPYKEIERAMALAATKK